MSGEAKMPMWLSKALAFVRRDMILQTSYRFAFVMNVLVVIFGVSAYYFLSRMVSEVNLPVFTTYGSGYFSFVLIGIACYHYMSIALGTFAGSIRQAQLFGTLEAMMMTRTSLTGIVLFSGLWAFLSTLGQLILYLGVGWILFGLDLSRFQLLSTVVMLLAIALSFSPLGILAASFVLAFKRGDPVFLAITGLSSLLGGVYYPVEILPKSLQSLAHFLPITASLEGLRKSIALGATISDLSGEIGALLVLTAILLPTALLCFHAAIRRAKVTGSLAQF